MYALSRPSRRILRSRGFGAPISGGAATADQIATLGASTTVAILTPLLALGPWGAVAGGLIALAGEIASLFGGCGQTCVQASNIANQVEPVLQRNLQQYLAAPAPRPASLQAGALNTFDAAWAALQQACSNPQLQAAGQRCVSDRAQGACHYKTSPGGWSGTTYTPPGASGSGSTCWNWFVGYRDPIANDPNVVPDPVSSGSSSLLSSVGIDPNASVFGLPLSDLLIPAALVFVGLFLIPPGDRR